MPWLNDKSMPEDGRDAEGWDKFWTAVLQQYESGKWSADRPYHGPFRTNEREDLLAYHADTFQHFGFKRVLFGGNGISAVPYFYQHRGFHVTALDISIVATKFCRRTSPTEQDGIPFFSRAGHRPGFMPGERREIEQKAGEAKVGEKRSGGSTEFVTADLFQWEPEDGAYDAIVLQKVVDRYPRKEDRQELAQRCFRWLRPGGILVVESYFLKFYYPDMRRPFGAEEEFERAGFRLHLREYALWHQSLGSFFYELEWGKMPTEENSRRREWYSAEHRKRYYGGASEDFRRLQEGERLAIFQYGTVAADIPPITPQSLGAL